MRAKGFETRWIAADLVDSGRTAFTPRARHDITQEQM